MSGLVTFDYVPLDRNSGLDYGATESRPVRGLMVQLFAGDQLVATTVTDENGRYTLTTMPNSEVFVRVRAEIVENGSSWDVRVVDNTREDAIYSMDSTPFNTGDADRVTNLHAASGWTENGYG